MFPTTLTSHLNVIIDDFMSIAFYLLYCTYSLSLPLSPSLFLPLSLSFSPLSSLPFSLPLSPPPSLSPSPPPPLSLPPSPPLPLPLPLSLSQRPQTIPQTLMAPSKERKGIFNIVQLHICSEIYILLIS